MAEDSQKTEDSQKIDPRAGQFVCRRKRKHHEAPSRPARFGGPVTHEARHWACACKASITDIVKGPLPDHCRKSTGNGRQSPQSTSTDQEMKGNQSDEVSDLQRPDPQEWWRRTRARHDPQARTPPPGSAPRK